MIRLYWKNATSEVVGPAHGVTPGDLEEIAPAVEDARQAVTEGFAAGALRYAGLPAEAAYRDRVLQLVARHRPNTTDLVVLGIGGSALGNIALQAALNPATYNLLPDGQRLGPRLFVLDNVDPALVADTMDLLGGRLATTLVNVVSKSGETAETASQFMIFRELLRRKLGSGFAGRIVATTDAAKGTLREIAAADGYEMMPVPDGVGGRFSVLSPVGLFSAAMCGIDIDALLAGAAAMRARVEAAGDWRGNIGCVLAAVHYVMFARKHKPMHVMMPYTNRLYMLADWYRQLWAESLGKRLDRDGREVFTGPTPIKALGTTDQHSQVQLHREGPNDKLTVFVEVARHPRELVVPDVFGDADGLSYLRGADLGALLNAEKRATEYALAVSARPTVTITLPQITPHAVGEVVFLYEFVTSLMGELLGIDAYDQPAVELGKQATFALMGRPGYEATARRIEPFLSVDEQYVV